MRAGGLEVEVKLRAGPDTESRLAALGATRLGGSSFRDRYFDTPDLRLARADHWLRLRQGAGWELKCPPAPRPTPPAPPGGATTYEELRSPGAVLGRLGAVLGAAPGGPWQRVAEAVAALGLREFASFRTRRRSYRLGALRVDLDRADFGYAVAEVEALVGAPEDVPAALEGVMQLRRALGQDGASPVPGKMSVYLQRHRPRHYQALLRAGVLGGDPQPPPQADTGPDRAPPGTGVVGAAEVEIGPPAP